MKDNTDKLNSLAGQFRDALLNLIADAERFDEDMDGDERGLVTIDYDLRVGHSQLAELAALAGIRPTYGQTVGDALNAAIEADYARATQEGSKP